MNTGTRKGVNRPVYGKGKPERGSASRDLPDPRYYVRMRLVRNLLWMLFIVFLLGLGAVLMIVVPGSVTSEGENQIDARRDPVEAKEH